MGGVYAYPKFFRFPTPNAIKYLKSLPDRSPVKGKYGLSEGPFPTYILIIAC